MDVGGIREPKVSSLDRIKTACSRDQLRHLEQMEFSAQEFSCPKMALSPSYITRNSCF